MYLQAIAICIFVISSIQRDTLSPWFYICTGTCEHLGRNCRRRDRKWVLGGIQAVFYSADDLSEVCGRGLGFYEPYKKDGVPVKWEQQAFVVFFIPGRSVSAGGRFRGYELFKRAYLCVIATHRRVNQSTSVRI